MRNIEPIRVIELFAGVGGFRLGLEGHPDPKWGAPTNPGFETVWASQWEPPGSAARQFAFRCYQERFDPDNLHPERLSNENITDVLDAVEAGARTLPDCDMIVGGFPCQDYSVAKTLSQAGGITGKKGVLWWDIYRLTKMKRPRYLLLENVDRLLKSPATQRGRDFAIMLSCLYQLGYSVEWRVINAAEYGFPQRRRRVFIFAERTTDEWELRSRALQTGLFKDVFPIEEHPTSEATFRVLKDPMRVSDRFGVGESVSPFMNAGVMQNGKVFTAKVVADYDGPVATLGSVLVSDAEVPESFFVDEESLTQWAFLKGGKSLERTSKTGHTYRYSEGSMAFPDPLDAPARTILTGEGGKSPSRFKHIIQDRTGRFRRLVPDELDQLQGFPKGWTDTGMTDGNRAFCMGNALVVGIPRAIGEYLANPVRAD